MYLICTTSLKGWVNLQARSPSQVQWVSWSTKITRSSLHWRLQNEWESGGSRRHQPSYYQNGQPICHQLSQSLPDNGTIFAAEATAIILELKYHQYVSPVHRAPCSILLKLNVLLTDDWGRRHWKQFLLAISWTFSGYWITKARMSISPGCRAIMALKEKKEWATWQRRPLARVHDADLEPLVNSYIEQLGQIKWGVAVHGRNLYLLKPTLGQQKEITALNQSWRGCNHPTS